MQHSNLEAYLKGKTLPNQEAPVKAIYRFGDRRIVVTKTGERETMSTNKLHQQFVQVLAEHQKTSMMKTLRRLSDGRASVQIGGKEKGERKTYASVAGAKAAVARHYSV